MKNLTWCIFILFFAIELFPQPKLGKHTVEEWRYIMDTTWGPGQSTEEKLQIFDTFWNTIDQKYAGFNGIVDNWQQLRSYRDTINQGVSRGRFAGILSHLVKSLHDGHVYMSDKGIASTPLDAGVPLLYSVGISFPSFNWESTNHFGAALTPLPDSSLLVYSTISNHPLGLVPGDLVLGYDGIPWKDLYKELFNVQFPTPFFMEMYSSEKAATHQWLQTAGMNWHLFDTIDIVKYGTEDTLHFSTSLLSDSMPKIFATEQLPINGVPFPDVANDHYVSEGYVSGTKIGYIYVWGWSYGAETEFLSAVNLFMADSCSDGLIIDVRLNEGGATSWLTGLKRLFNQNIETMRWLVRSSSSNHLLLGDAGELYLTGSDTDLYDRPIAVLCGPSTISNGDWFVHVLREHPMVRTFGLPTNGSFGTYNTISGIPIEWGTGCTELVLYTPPNMNNILNHRSVPVDEEIWLTRDGAANGQDDVVNGALRWINNLVYGHHLTKNIVSYIPGNDTLKISAWLENPNSHQVTSKVYISNLTEDFRDSLELQKVGMSGESEIWSGIYIAVATEDIFKLSLSAVDISHSKTFTTDNISRFTTAGPVNLDSLSYRKGLLNYHYVRPFVHNWGNVKTISNASIKLKSSDPWIKSIGQSIPIPDIPSGSTVGASSWCTLQIIDSLFPGYFNFKAEIMSDGWTYWIDSTKMIVTVVDDEVQQPITFKLEQNYPNPFNPTTTIGFGIPEKINVRLSVLNILGEEIEILLNEEKEAGYHSIDFNASDLPSGVYFYRLQSGNFIDSKKMLLLK